MSRSSRRPWSRRSKRGNLQRGDIVDAHQFSGEEGLAVTCSDERAVIRSVVRDDVVQRLAFGVHSPRLDLAVELRAVAAYRFELACEIIADVHDEGWAHEVLPIREAMQDLVRPMLRH